MEISEKIIPGHLLEIGESFEQKFVPVLNFDDWRIAMLRHSQATDREFFYQVERHNETCEVFILTAGQADLILCENGDIPGNAFVKPMKTNVAYNVLPAVWHHIILSNDAHIIIFEKSNTTRENSNYFKFEPDKISGISQLLRKL